MISHRVLIQYNWRNALSDRHLDPGVIAFPTIGYYNIRQMLSVFERMSSMSILFTLQYSVQTSARIPASSFTSGAVDRGVGVSGSGSRSACTERACC